MKKLDIRKVLGIEKYIPNIIGITIAVHILLFVSLHLALIYTFFIQFIPIEFLLGWYTPPIETPKTLHISVDDIIYTINKTIDKFVPLLYISTFIGFILVLISPAYMLYPFMVFCTLFITNRLSLHYIAPFIGALITYLLYYHYYLRDEKRSAELIFTYIWGSIYVVITRCLAFLITSGSELGLIDVERFIAFTALQIFYPYFPVCVLWTIFILESEEK